MAYSLRLSQRGHEMAKGTTPLNKVPRSWAGSVVCDTNAIGTGAVTANELAAGAVTSAKLSANAAVRRVNGVLPTIPTAAGTTEILLIAPCAGTLSAGAFVGANSLAANDTNYVAFTLVNKGQLGAGSAQMLAASPNNTSKATGGAALTGYVPYTLALTGTQGNLVVAKGDVLVFQAVGNGTLANTVTEGQLSLEITPS